MTPTFTSCAEAVSVIAKPAETVMTAVAAKAAIIRLDLKILPDFRKFRSIADSSSKAGNGASEVRPERCGPSSRNGGALLWRRLTGGHSMTAWTRTGMGGGKAHAHVAKLNPVPVPAGVR